MSNPMTDKPYLPKSPCEGCENSITGKRCMEPVSSQCPKFEQYKSNISALIAYRFTFNEGAKAYHEAVVKWLFEPCTKHPDCDQSSNRNLSHGVLCCPLHRYQCPECMKEFGGK